MNNLKLILSMALLVLVGAVLASCGGSPSTPGSSSPKPAVGSLNTAVNGTNVTGNTTGHTNNINMHSCGGYHRGDDAPEDLWTIDVDKNVTPQITFSLCGGATWDTLLYIMDGNYVAVCSDDFCGSQSQIGVIFNASKRFYVVVDGYGGASGSYSLHVTAP